MDSSYLKSVLKSIALQKPLFFIIPTIFLLLAIGISLGFVYQQSFKKEEIVFEEFGEKTASPSSSVKSFQTVVTIKVEISGAVVNSGVYEMNAGDRVEDLIKKAGGFSNEADLDWIVKNLNQAEKLNDGEKIYISTKEEVKQDQTSNGSRGVINSPAGVDINSNKSSACSSQININTASQDELDRCLSGIGPTYAQRIVEYREKSGGFKTIEEIKNVSGIGEKTFEKIREKITVF